MALAPSLWLGGDAAEARRVFTRALEAGMTALRALALGNVASFRDCWAFRRTIAKRLGCSIRTVARAFRQGAELGMLGRGRAERGERTPGDPSEGGGKVFPCGWSHRWIIGRGTTGAEATAREAAARARWLVKRAFAATKAAPAPAPAPTPAPTPAPPRAEYRRAMSAEEIDRILEREARERPPPDPDG